MTTLVKVAGVAMFKGEMKVRFADDMTYVKRMAKGGNTDINLIDLPNEMTRQEAVSYLLTTDMAKDPATQATLDEALARYVDIATVAAKKAALSTGGAAVVVKAAKTPKPAKAPKAAKKEVEQAAE
jgi:hypothetical protein